jgi:hypothetical protein
MNDLWAQMSGLGLGLPGYFIRQAIDCFALLGNEKHRRRIQSKPYVIWIIPGGEIYHFFCFGD